MSYLDNTAPFCGNPACYVHPVFGSALEVEHHVEGCFAGGTFHSSIHRLDHAFQDAAETFRQAGVDLRAFARKRSGWRR